MTLWKSVAWAGCLLPVLAGCGAARNLATETRLAHTQRAIERDLRADARAAWQTVRGQHPRRAFTDEFRDGFLDGFVDYLDRGGAAQPPAVPPIQYVRDKKYFTPEGHCLINDYYLGFKYGADVAVASGRRQFLTVPVLLADPACPVDAPPAPGAPTVPFVPIRPKPKSDDPLPPPRPVPGGGNKFSDPNKGPDDPLQAPPDSQPSPGFGSGAGRPIPPLPKPELPVIKPFNPDLSGGGKFSPLPVPPDPDLLPVPYPPLPVPGPQFEPLPVPPSEPRGAPPPTLGPLPVPLPVPALKVYLPPLPDAVPALPANVPTPSILDDIPVVPFRHSVPAPGAGLLPRTK